VGGGCYKNYEWLKVENQSVWCFGKGTSSAPKTFTFWGFMLILRGVSRGSNGFFYGFLDGTNFEMATNLRF